MPPRRGTLDLSMFYITVSKRTAAMYRYHAPKMYRKTDI
jgi:hypothetical protein